MADELSIKIDASIDTASNAKSIAELKKSMKELNNLALQVGDSNKQAFQKLTAAAAEARDKVDDLKDAVGQQAGSGIEKLNTSFGMLSESIMNVDAGKFKGAMQGIGAAMDAIPIFLLVEGLKYVWENFDKIVEIGKQVFNSFSDEERAVKSSTAAYEKQKEVTGALVKQYDREIALLTANGASETKIIEVKKQKMLVQIAELKASIKVQDAIINEIKANDDLSESLANASAWIQRKLGNEKAAQLYEQVAAFEKQERIKEEVKKREEANQNIADLENNLKILEIDNTKAIVAEGKKASEEKAKRGEDNYNAYKEQLRKEQEARDAAYAEENMIIEDQSAKDEARRLQEIEDAKAVEALKFGATLDAYYKKKALDEQEAEDKKKLREIERAENQKLQDASFGSAKALSDAVFAMQLNGVTKGSKAELEIRKKQFQVDKAFSIGRVIIDGVRAVQANLAIGPAGIPLAIAAGVTAAANVVKIASTKFDGGGSGAASGGGGASTGSVGGGVAAPDLSSKAFDPSVIGKAGNMQTNGAATSSASSASNNSQRVFVVESDITKTQNKVKTIETLASF